jgi:hypothetical protein
MVEFLVFGGCCGKFRDQHPKKSAKRTRSLVVVSRFHFFLVQNLFSQPIYNPTKHRSHGVGPSGVGGYMRKRKEI